MLTAHERLTAPRAVIHLPRAVVLAANWSRAYSQRKSVPLAFLISN